MEEAGRTRIFNRIKKSNAAFKKMEVAEKRVAVAKDVISLLNTGMIDAVKSNVYLQFDSRDYIGADQAQEAFKTQACTVCAIGAVFYADICRTNDITCSEANENDDMVMMNRTEGIFSYEEMRIIERAFETNRSGNHHTPECQFGLNYDDDNARLKAIMKNIIKNKGTFKP